MAYDNTSVPVSRSQEAIRKLIMSHGGFGLAVVSEGLPGGHISQEGFQAKVMINDKPYTVKVMAAVKAPAKTRRNTPADHADREARRVWRVLFYHMKSVFEAADSGVMEFRELMLPYIVTGNKQTVAERLLPELDEIVTMHNSSRMLTA